MGIATILATPSNTKHIQLDIATASDHSSTHYHRPYSVHGQYRKYPYMVVTTTVIRTTSWSRVELLNSTQ